MYDGRSDQEENLSSPESCNVCSATSPDEMTSVRVCYCKQKDDILRKKDDDVGLRDENGHLATTAASKKSVITKAVYGSSGGSPRRTSVIGEKMPNRNWPAEEQPVNTILSPETSTALENAEKIINNAKIQLMEVCGMSSIDSARRCRNTPYSELPLDNESEELLYIRELVASKFHEATSRSETNDKASVNTEESARRTDLSAPKFRTSRRRHADRSSLRHESDNRSCERAAAAEGAPSKDSIENAATMRDDDRRRASSAASTERELVRAQGNACRIQTGPSMHIVDRELTKQNLEDVHISPVSSWAQSHANIATYTIRHGGNIPENVASEPEASKATKIRRVRLDAPRQRERPIVAEIVTEATDAPNRPEKQVEDTGRNDGPIESPKSQAKDHVCAEGGTHRALHDTKVSERAERVTDRGAAVETAIEKLRSEPRKEDRAEITSGDDANDRHAEEVDRKSGVDERARRRSDENVDRIQSDRSKSLLVGDASATTGFPRRENIVSRCRRKPRRIIDEHPWSTTFDSHDEQRSFASSCSGEAGDDASDLNLYRPHFEDFDAILSSNNRKIERTMRAMETFNELLSKFEFAGDQLDERTLRCVNFEEFYDSEEAFVPNEPGRSSILETELKTEDLAAETRRAEASANPQTVPVDLVGKESNFTEDNDRPGDQPENSAESNVYSEPNASGGSGTSLKRDKTQKATSEEHSSLSSLDKWDVTTFSNMIPALSSTRTETQDSDRDAKLRATTANQFSQLNRPQQERSDSVFAHIARSLMRDDVADRFVSYFLRDERQSVEGKVTDALKKSAIEPATVRKLLDRLREAETIRDARRTETLDILKTILIDAEKETTDQGNKAANSEEKTASRNISVSSIGANAAPNAAADDLAISREENAQQARTGADEIGRVVENCRDLKTDDKHSSGSKSDGKTKENLRSKGESLRQISDTRDDDNRNDGRSLQNLTAKAASEKPDGERGIEIDGRDTAIAPSGNEEGHTNGEDHENEPARVQDNEDPASGERRENKSIIIMATDNHRDENKTSVLLPRSDNGQQTASDLARLDVSGETFDVVTEIRVEGRHENSTSMNKKSACLEGSETGNERVHLEASSAGSKFADKIAIQENASLVAQEDIESLHVNENNAQQLEEKISPADCRPADSSRDCASLLSPKNERSPLEDVASTSKRVSANFAGEDNWKDIRGDEVCGKSTTVEDHRDGSTEGRLLNGARRDNEEQSLDRTNTLRKYKINILSSSNSSISSTLLDHDDRFGNGVLSAHSKKIETSSEASHSEGELYMPSSCSYSLGEVRILKKRNFIADSTMTDRDSSTTVLITRSMLTSLNDSTASLLGDSGRI